MKSKLCVHCGRRFSWRRKWSDCWHQVRHCSTQCQRESKRARHAAYETAIFDLLEQRADGGSICPSEVARQLHSATAWREAMEDVRRAARRLAQRNQIAILQRGRPVDPASMRGPVRLARKQ